MKYIEIRLNVKANNVSLVTDVIAALLAEAGYDSFVPDATGVCAYIPGSATNYRQSVYRCKSRLDLQTFCRPKLERGMGKTLFPTYRRR